MSGLMAETLSPVRTVITRLFRILAVLVAAIVVPASAGAQQGLRAFPGSVAGPGFVVRYGEGDSLRAQAVDPSSGIVTETRSSAGRSADRSADGPRTDRPQNNAEIDASICQFL